MLLYDEANKNNLFHLFLKRIYGIRKFLIIRPAADRYMAFVHYSSLISESHQLSCAGRFPCFKRRYLMCSIFNSQINQSE